MLVLKTERRVIADLAFAPDGRGLVAAGGSGIYWWPDPAGDPTPRRIASEAILCPRRSHEDRANRGSSVPGPGFGRSRSPGRGAVALDDWLSDPRADWRPHLNDHYHHIGTTRMDPDPRRGVVDTDCRVHGVRNLYIASSSVFPTGGFSNPTLTILALAMRLADHLATALRTR